MSYACSVWVKAVDKKVIKQKLQSIQRLIALRITKAYKTVSNEALDVIANLIPIDLYLKKTAINYFIKTGTNNTLTNEYLNEDRIDLRDIQKPFPVRQLKHYAKRKPINITNESTTRYTIFTDRSKSLDGVGSGYCVYDNEIVIKTGKQKLAKYCSVFQAELLAIKSSIMSVNCSKFKNNTITIKTDSMASILALKDPNSTTTLVQDIQRLL
jgi:hypothetical protein